MSPGTFETISSPESAGIPAPVPESTRIDCRRVKSAWTRRRGVIAALAE